MTTQLSRTPSGPSTPPAAAIVPPSFADIAKEQLQQLLARDYPSVVIDVDNTWLNLYEHKTINIPPITEFPTPAALPMPRSVRRLTRAMPLHDSVIEHFLGKLILDEEGSYGLFVHPTAVAETEQVEGLGQEDIQYLYARLTSTLADAYTESLLSYWSTADTDGKTRRTLFIEERAQALQMEAHVRVEQGSLTTVQSDMLEAMLRYSQDQSDDPLQKHGVYSVSLTRPGQSTLDFTGCFVLSDVCNTDKPYTDDARLGAVLFYAPNTGLEGFASFPLLTESLTQRFADPEQKEGLLKNVALNRAAPLVPEPQLDPNAAPYAWGYLPIDGNFLNLEFGKQRLKQLSDFAHCVDLAKARALDCQGFLALLSHRLDLRYQFDNFLNLDRNDSAIVDASMPDWWHTMSVEDKHEWLESAKTFGGSIIELQQATQNQLNTPEFSSEFFLSQYVDSILNAALHEKNIQQVPDKIYVDIFYFAEIPRSLFPPQVILPRADAALKKRYTLKSLAIEQPDTLNLGYLHRIVVTDENNAPIKGLDADAISDLIARVNLKDAFDHFLVARLKTSAYAQTLREKSTRLTLVQMRMGLLVAKQKGFEQAGLDWITAVLNTPDASTPRHVKLKNIQLKFLKIQNVALSNVMLIAPSDAGENSAVVLCTLNAPDGVVFRWFDSIAGLKRDFLDHLSFSEYLALQMPVAQRAGVQKSLQFDDWFKHYRLPDFFRYLPQPVPIPAMVWGVITFVEQSKDFLTENHDIRLDQMISDAKSYEVYSRNIQSSDHTTDIHLAIGIALLFLPAPVMIPLALGLALYTAWDGLRKVDNNDYKGAAEELLIALNYLVIAGAGTLSLPTKDVPSIKALHRAPPLVRRIGPDGKERIGFLLSPVLRPQLASLESATVLDPEKLSIVEIDGETFYVRNRFNLFGHSRLYRQLPDNPGVLTDSGEFGLLDSKGVWIRALSQARGASAQVFQSASRELERLTTRWPLSVESLSITEKTQFETDYLSLAKTSNAESLPDIFTYCEAGSGDINDVLRAGIKNATTRRFLRNLYRLNEYQGMAFRVSHVSSASLQRLKGKIGLIYADKGVQSASVSRFNATRWSENTFVTQHATADNHLIFMIFDKSIPKKNMFSPLLGDHVGITPGTPMQLTAIREVDGKFFTYFSMPQKLGNELFDIYTGEQETSV